MGRQGCSSKEKWGERVGPERPGPAGRAQEWMEPERGQPGHWATEFLELKENILRRQPVQSLHAAAGTPKPAKEEDLPEAAQDGSDTEGRQT